jgi:hypothetical protein
MAKMTSKEFWDSIPKITGESINSGFVSVASARVKFDPSKMIKYTYPIKIIKDPYKNITGTLEQKINTMLDIARLRVEAGIYGLEVVRK